MAQEYPERFGVGGVNNGIVGATIVSETAATIVITHKIHMLSGTGAMSSITPPWPTFAGTILLIPTGICTFTSTGNVRLAITTVAQQALELAYNPVTGYWYPVGDVS
jgi:hypothetical protein